MDFVLDKNKLNINPAQFMRQAGYHFIVDRNTGNETFVRRLGASGHYPRFHMYIKEGEHKIEFSLHLDQKKPVYPGQHAHNAEYDGEAVAGEIERLKGLLREIYAGQGR